jgi:ATP-dependent DNA helicase DinG
VIEVEVHQQLRALLREQATPHWEHHLTMARLVARALRLGRSALIQTGTESGLSAPYRLSYLMPLLLWEGPAIVVASESVQQWLTRTELPRLQQWLDAPKPVQKISPHSPAQIQGFSGISLVTPHHWLRDRLEQRGEFPPGILTIVDGVDDLDAWVKDVLSLRLQSEHWEQLMLSHPNFRALLLDLRISITHALFQHPPNPYNCYVLEPEDYRPLQQLLGQLQQSAPLPVIWSQLFQQLSRSLDLDADRTHRDQQILREKTEARSAQSLADPGLLSAKLDRQSGSFTLQQSPIRFAPLLQPLWQAQPTVLIGSALDLDANADTYRLTHGLQDLTCLKFSPPRHDAGIQLYQPDRIPMPNTPQFQPALLAELRQILSRSRLAKRLIVILVGDTPLRNQVGATLAAEWGSRVQVDRIPEVSNGILVTGWTEWQQFQAAPPGNVELVPHCIVIATLPMPSLEDPIVAARVRDYKRMRQDWFRLYLLPTALMALQRAIFPVRSSRGLVALLDSRVLHRNYGQQVLSALSPYARLNYLDESWESNGEDWHSLSSES